MRYILLALALAVALTRLALADPAVGNGNIGISGTLTAGDCIQANSATSIKDSGSANCGSGSAYVVSTTVGASVSNVTINGCTLASSCSIVGTGTMTLVIPTTSPGANGKWKVYTDVSVTFNPVSAVAFACGIAYNTGTPATIKGNIAGTSGSNVIVADSGTYMADQQAGADATVSNAQDLQIHAEGIYTVNQTITQHLFCGYNSSQNQLMAAYVRMWMVPN